MPSDLRAAWWRAAAGASSGRRRLAVGRSESGPASVSGQAPRRWSAAAGGAAREHGPCKTRTGSGERCGEDCDERGGADGRGARRRSEEPDGGGGQEDGTRRKMMRTLPATAALLVAAFSGEYRSSAQEWETPRSLGEGLLHPTVRSTAGGRTPSYHSPLRSHSPLHSWGKDTFTPQSAPQQGEGLPHATMRSTAGGRTSSPHSPLHRWGKDIFTPPSAPPRRRAPLRTGRPLRCRGNY